MQIINSNLCVYYRKLKEQRRQQQEKNIKMKQEVKEEQKKKSLAGMNKSVDGEDKKEEEGK